MRQVSVVLEPDEGESRQPLNLIDVDVQNSPREARLAALLLMAETVVAQMDEEKGS